MTFNAAMMSALANHAESLITHAQLHSAQPNAGYTDNVIGTRVAINGAVSGDDIDWDNISFTGLSPNSPVWGISYWSAATGGTNYGGAARTDGDATANAAGEYTVVNAGENGVPPT